MTTSSAVAGKGFINFLEQRNLVQLAVGFLLATQINQLVSTFVDDIISPILFKIFNVSGAKQFNKMTIKIFGVELLVGNFILNFIKFTILIYIVYKIVTFIDYIGNGYGNGT